MPALSKAIVTITLLLLSGVFLMTGCGSPSAANITLRKQNQLLQDQVDHLAAQHHRDIDTLAACQRSHPTTATIPPDRLALLTTTHGLSFGRLTGGDNPDSTKNFDTQLKVYIVPVDGDGVPIKAAGSFKIEAFDLADSARQLVGTWTFDLNQTSSLFFNRFAMYTYVLTCPWQSPPAHEDLTIHVTFDDALTGRQFVDQIQAKVRLVPVKQ